ncbi:cobalt-precorrin-5B (C(1))-methyltransferase [Microbispora sp. ATCC PTA-5024]|uniref:cobalt-precorrin-5B (C(1))-methyltransferase n=1 Tax=Microbispora sp. ATCC PTA-5024 TaxID=316330 RepID=UPI0003DB7E5A|nr:cobalt-precorrin-5B (C(1))-methyltransferase [Microbispora sp. ATCC PTA-5024]ETK37096.1 cobalt-precorrin-6A synthase [Microbispora sp. ATCC PTA-5024]
MTEPPRPEPRGGHASGPAEPDGPDADTGRPELREPDLPRTMRVRKRALRTGWTTGTCSAAAAKAASIALAHGDTPPLVDTPMPGGGRVELPVESYDLGDGRATAVVVKDAGDDPDVTHGAHMTATVSWRRETGIELDGGVGVGVVTRPGLGLEVGGPAINPVPRAQITQAVGEVLDLERHGVRVIISVPEGERMARKTTNARLGILGGISILGTTGVVRPFSTESWRSSVVQAISVMAAQGERTLVLSTGGRTDRAAMRLRPDLPEVCFVEVGDFTGAALRRAVEAGLSEVVFVGMAGKLAKLAAGVLMTHYTRSKVDRGLLASITGRAGGDEALIGRVAEANTARHAYELWEEAGLLEPAARLVCVRVKEVLERFTEGALAATVVMVDPDGHAPVASSEGAVA